jgi:hypothetical protein
MDETIVNWVCLSMNSMKCLLPWMVGVESWQHTSECTSFTSFNVPLTLTQMNFSLYLAWMNMVQTESLLKYCGMSDPTELRCKSWNQQCLKLDAEMMRLLGVNLDFVVAMSGFWDVEVSALRGACVDEMAVVLQDESTGNDAGVVREWVVDSVVRLSSRHVITNVHSTANWTGYLL